MLGQALRGGYMSENFFDLKKYAMLARQAAAEGCVLLENENGALPLKSGNRIALFGRSAFHYYKSGLGSGGLVHTRYVVGIFDALKNCDELTLDQELLSGYENWVKENPYEEGEGWGNTPWSQKERPVTTQMLEACKRTDASIIIIGRTAGEDQDNSNSQGSYLLTEEEETLIKKVCEASKRTIVLLNTGNIIDMRWVKKYQPQAVLYVWQGGQEGGNGVLDVLLGRVNPCGKLTDTIAETLEAYPSTRNFGDSKQNIYQEDIYVGYRYFETFAKEKVLYPFGYGKSYTEFSIKETVIKEKKSAVTICAEVKNIGNISGKEIVQIYLKAPQGKLGNPTRKLVAFQKTKELRPDEKQTLQFQIDNYTMAAYDDSGASGQKSAYVLEEGTYEFFMGSDVRSAVSVGTVYKKSEVVQQCTPSCTPIIPYQRVKPRLVSEENYECKYECSYEEMPIMPRSQEKPCKQSEIAYKGDQGYRLVDVLDQKISMELFLSQLSNQDLICMFRGEGMCSPRVTPGTAAAFGGVSESLEKFGIPAACCSDGPSGIRMDCGTKAFSLPNGTALGCTFNEDLVEELFEMTGRELYLNKIDALLGPGMNIHRNPLNGRNFEYISEDPLVTGKIAAAQVRAMNKSGIAGTIKHFCANNQEYGRRSSNSVVSERALREIYLRGFEIAVKEGSARAVMTTYGSVNGLWTAGDYDLCTKILRDEWGFKGIVMSDWWAEANYENSESDVKVKAPMIKAQNDLYMCVQEPSANPENDDVEEMLEKGYITRVELQRNAVNILNFILESPALLRMEHRIQEEEPNWAELFCDESENSNLLYQVMDKGKDILELYGYTEKTRQGQEEQLGIELNEDADYAVAFTVASAFGPLAQLPISIFIDEIWKITVNIQGSENQKKEHIGKIGRLTLGKHRMRLFYGATGLELFSIKLKKITEK